MGAVEDFKIDFAALCVEGGGDRLAGFRRDRCGHGFERRHPDKRQRARQGKAAGRRQADAQPCEGARTDGDGKRIC